MSLLDTNVVTELRKRDRANQGAKQFLQETRERGERAYLSVITIGELRRGVDLIRHRGDQMQADALEKWRQQLLNDYAENILDFGKEEAQVLGRIRVPHPENALDKQIAYCSDIPTDVS